MQTCVRIPMAGAAHCFVFSSFTSASLQLNSETVFELSSGIPLVDSGTNCDNRPQPATTGRNRQRPATTDDNQSEK